MERHRWSSLQSLALLTAAVLLASPHHVSGIRCYFCSFEDGGISSKQLTLDGRQQLIPRPSTSPSCKSNPSSSSLTTCDSTSKACMYMKYRYPVPTDDGNSDMIGNAYIRDCAQPSWPTEGCLDARDYYKQYNPSLQDFKSGTVCFCSTDNCNTGTAGVGTIFPHPQTLLVAVLAACKLYGLCESKKCGI